MANLVDMIVDDGLVENEVSVPPEEGLNRLRDKIKEKLRLEAEVEDKECEIQILKEKINTLTVSVIPRIFTELRMRQFVMDDGTEVEVSKKHYASITKKNQDAAFAWLRSSGNGDLIKNTFQMEFGRGEDDKANLLLTLVNWLPEPPDVVQKEKVNDKTLGAFVREQLEAGNLGLPMDLLGAHVVDVAEVTKSKSKKGRKAK